jgi:hypothetical protein
MGEWQPIATAPRDGTVVLVYREIAPWRVVGWARWEGIELGDFNRPQTIGGWISNGFYDPPGNLGLGHPTHWMPLPEPPVSP